MLPFPDADLDSICTSTCSVPSASPAAFSWTSGGTYLVPQYAGADDCTFTCATNYYLAINGAAPPINNCVPCSQNPVLCPVGQYLDLVGCDEGAFVDSQCLLCTNRPSYSTYTGYGTADGNDCAWQCDLGYYSNLTHCLSCSESACDLGDYRDQCDRGTNLLQGTDSICNQRCTGPIGSVDTGIGAVQTAFTWTTPGSYDPNPAILTPPLYMGVNDCTFTCNFQGGDGYYAESPTVCTKITAR